VEAVAMTIHTHAMASITEVNQDVMEVSKNQETYEVLANGKCRKGDSNEETEPPALAEAAVLAGSATL
jgi:predicted Zn-dependent protease